MPVFAPNSPVIYTVDLLMQILQFLSWDSLLLWDNMPGEGRQARRNEVRRRVFDALERFITRSEIPTFFDALEMGHGLITGSVVRQVLWFGGEKEGTVPFDLNIIIPRSGTDDVHRFLVGMGYTREEGVVRERYSGLMTTVELYTKEREGGKIMQISVCHSRKTALSVVIGAPNTAGMNAISSDSIFAFYPALLRAGEGLWLQGASEDELEEGRVEGRGLALYNDNAHWEHPCGESCPMVWRKTLDDKGLGMYEWHRRRADSMGRKKVGRNWNDPPSPPPFKPMEDNPVGFRVLSRCRNDACDNCRLYDERLQYFIP